MDSLIVHRDLGLQVGLGGLLTFLPLLVHSRLGLNLGLPPKELTCILATCLLCLLLQ